MTKLAELRSRLASLEGGGGADAELTFANGSHASLRVRDGLGLVLSAMRSESARLDGQEPEPSKYAAKLNLLAHAVECRTEDNLLQMAHGICRERAE